MRRALVDVVALLAALAVPPSVAAMTVDRLVVGERGGRWFVEFDASLAAPAAEVMAVLQDYAGYPALDPRIVTARLVGEHEGRPLLYTRLHGCVAAWFCRDMDRYEQLEEGDRVLVALAVPGRGDLEYGRTETRVEPLPEGGARVRYSTEFDPTFWMPRWLVRSAMERTLERGTLAMFGNVETRAREREGMR